MELCGSLCDLSVFVVRVFLSNFTTETQRTTELAQRNRSLRQTLLVRLGSDDLFNLDAQVFN